MMGEIIMIGVFLILGFTFYIGRGEFLIAGFNTLSEEEKNKYDVKSLLKFIGKVMFSIAISIVFSLLSNMLSIHYLSTIGVVLLMSTVIFALIILSSESNFLKKS